MVLKKMSEQNKSVYDYVIVGSGFGGAVSALRLSQKGYSVLVIEKGRWFSGQSHAKSAWNLSRWLWLPILGWRGIMKLTVFRHLTVYSGVGVGGGSLTYGATLPTPKSAFFNSGSWASMQNWEQVLKPHYEEALRMLGATVNPNLTEADFAIKKLAEDIGKERAFEAARVGVFFTQKSNPYSFEADPYFDGEGPARRGCISCGSCMTGCRHEAKNTLDKNYLFFAQKKGAVIQADTEVEDVVPAGKKDGSQGYFVTCRGANPYSRGPKRVFYAKGVVFAGGVLGTVPLLIRLKASGALDRLSNAVGNFIRTNNETITSVTSFKDEVNFATGVSIGSVLHTDENSHLEPINQNSSSGLLRLLTAPKVKGSHIFSRLGAFVKVMLLNPKNNLRVLFTKNWGEKTLQLLFMQHLDSTLKFEKGMGNRIRTALGTGNAPSNNIPESSFLTEKVAEIVGGQAAMGMTEAVLGTPSTAHILGGAVMGDSSECGVINDKSEVYGYQNLYVCDGSAISANPGVNPSLSITAITEWSMSHIPTKKGEY